MPLSIDARSVLLSLMRVTPERALPVKRLLEIGALFGIKENAVRVAIVRMVNAGLLESDERGSYRMGPQAKALGAHIEAWRKGEARMRPWRGGVIAVALGPAPDRTERRASLRALSRLGMAEGLPGFWMRPDNLAESFEVTCERLGALGLEASAEPMRSSELSARLERRLHTELWPLRELQRGYERALSDLRRSVAQLDRMPREAALVQTFLVGGAAIRVLATDPLLPEEILPSETRAELTASMLRYDAIGHRLWSQAAKRAELRVISGGHAGRSGRAGPNGPGGSGGLSRQGARRDR